MAQQDRWILDYLVKQPAPKGYAAPTAEDLLVLDDPGNGVATAAWVSDSKHICIASIRVETTGGQESEFLCLPTPDHAAFWTDMFGPGVLDDLGADGHTEHWFAVVVASTEQLVLYDGSRQVVEPLHQTTVRSADGVVISFVTFNSVDEVLGSIPADRSRAAQLCTRSRSVCKTAMPITWLKPWPWPDL